MEGEHTWHRLEIGNYSIVLDLRNKQERMHFEKARTIDSILAERYVVPGDVVLDVGANIGLMALLFVRYGASRVYAFEPMPSVYARLEQLNCPLVITACKALTDSVGQESMFVSETHNQGHTLNGNVVRLFPGVFGESPKTTSVSTTRLDSVLPVTPFDYVKVDVEGSELRFLRGADATFRFRVPRMMQIEAFDPFRAAMHQEAFRWYRFVRRAGFVRATGRLVLMPVTPDPPTDGGLLCLDPPTYIYTNDESLFRS